MHLSVQYKSTYALCLLKPFNGAETRLSNRLKQPDRLKVLLELSLCTGKVQIFVDDSPINEFRDSPIYKKHEVVQS